MIDVSTLKKAWALLEPSEQRSAMVLVVIVIVAALASASMVGSIFPFLSLLADPSLLERSEWLSYAYEAGGFESEFQFLTAVGIATSLVILVTNAILAFNIYAMARYTQMRVYSISRRLLSHYLAQPYEFFLTRHSGDMTTNILGESNTVVARYMRPFVGLVSAAFTIVAIFIALLIVNPVVTLVAITSFALIYAIVVLMTRKGVKDMGDRRLAANQKVFRLSGEALSGIKDIKLLGKESTYVDRYSEPAHEMATFGIWISIISSAPQFILQVVAFGGIVLLSLALVEPNSLNERAALGELLPLLGVLAFAGQRLLPQLHAVYGAVTEMSFGKAAVERVYKDLSWGHSNSVDRSRPEPLRCKQSLELKNVCYTYPNAEAPGVNDVSLKIQSGERIGIVGSSGAGKTTLADVVLGLLTPQAGTILTDGTPIITDNLRAWQRSVGYVPQDIFLTDASLLENIALGTDLSEIDRAKVESCARIAQLHEFIVSELPNGYDTEIGERGVRLSGGQRQRIGIARALYHDADLIVFDEATSALDNLTEREVMASIEALPGDKTILMIAHRLSTVKVCDRIVVMDRGTVSGVDTWDTLVETNHSFQKIAQSA